jgi:hypothetical protein
MRDIQDVLVFREDISPFLTHLTRVYSGRSASENLTNILNEKKLRYGEPISPARFAYPFESITPKLLTEYFTAISFTETPLNEIHCLIEVAPRQINLEPYGLVFMKENLMKKAVTPVFYFNNIQGETGRIFSALCSLINTNPGEAAQILPFVSFFGQLISPEGAKGFSSPPIDFTWEREWRYASEKGFFEFTEEDIFVGLCPQDEIPNFESSFPPIEFIDPIRNMKWYAEKLIRQRKRIGFKNSVV